MKKFFSIILVMLLVLSFNSTVLAESIIDLRNEDNLDGYDLIVPMWNESATPDVQIHVNGNSVICIGTVRGLPGTSKISATFRLEKKGWFGWSEVASWDRTSYSDYLSFSGSSTAESGATYRFSVVATVTRNGSTETVSSLVEGRN